MRTFSDTPKTFTFHYTFKNFDTAQVACHAILGYMTGTYEQPVIDATYHNDDQGGHANQLVLKYAEDRKLNKVFKRICDSFKDYYNQSEDMTDEELDHQRVVSLSKSTQGKVNNRDTLIAFISDHNQLAEHLSMNYKEMTPEDLGAILESISQAFNHLYDMVVEGQLLVK
ncbi:TPA: hypothetical protein VIU19_000436 [Streptococcus pyogenes]|uniref:Phage protein n=1 Tax=Streptococcus dysgalactiae TaxID=1334 RepID=A0ABU0A6K4_STRDY|nr:MULTISPECIES: hypothetical protein [Streptococcus]EGL47434.1 hypothetical protein HMPREF9964_1532 [Streptococcus dysgalactiae subsp. equisimilis SK1249]HER4652557.1 hypothetical protein [Streptococcus pyogenes NGAS500]HER4670008.1 hypothetical protein [Streptococcus pyogenes NGAS438]MDQ0262927.1 hypothetical protein [Streptococcus dysgalactiae]QQC55278.1 hypothetical protein I6H73_10400 [Streptococcus dysgalactiae]